MTRALSPMLWRDYQGLCLALLATMVMAAAWLRVLWSYRTGCRPRRSGFRRTVWTPRSWDLQELNAGHLPALEREGPGSAVRSRLRFHVRSPWLHPVGVYPATLAFWEEAEDEDGFPIIRWLFESSLYGPAGQAAQLPYTTPLTITPRNEAGRLLQALRLPMPTSDAEAERIDPDELLGTPCLIRVAHRDSTLRRRSRGAVVAEVLPCRVQAPCAFGRRRRSYPPDCRWR